MAHIFEEREIEGEGTRPMLTVHGVMFSVDKILVNFNTIELHLTIK